MPVYQHSTTRIYGRGTPGVGNLCPVFHKLLASTWQLLFSPSYCYLHALLKHLSPLIDLRQICFVQLVTKDQALPGPAALQNCTGLRTPPGNSGNFSISGEEKQRSPDSGASTGFSVNAKIGSEDSTTQTFSAVTHSGTHSQHHRTVIRTSGKPR